MKKIGVFVCWCGSNIADGVDVNRVVEEVKKIPDVHHAENYMYMCSDPGQQLIKDAIKKENLDAVVVACCSPRMHENTFRKAAGSVGLNPYLVEIANIREQCSWVHQNNKPVATAKAVNIIRGTLAKVRENLPLETIAIGLNKRVLVVGGGIAGLVAARDLADAGYEVVIVEKKPRPGGHMAQLHLTFPYFQSASKLLEKQIAVIENHPKVTLYCNAEVEQLDGYVGNFEVTINRRSTGVDAAQCTGCGACLDACPVRLPDAFNRGLTERAAIYLFGAGADAGRAGAGVGKAPVPVIDFAACTHAVDGCDKCAAVCEAGAIDLEAPPEEHVTEEVGAIVMATGYDLMDIRRMPEYGAGQLPDVIDGLAFERMLDPNGPTGGRILRPSDGREPKNVVFVQCAGSRDPERYKPYCSRACCMYVAKQARLLRRQVPDAGIYISYMDIRSDSRDFEEFVQQGMEEDRLVYIRGRVAKVFADGDHLKVKTADTLAGRQLDIDADLVVLALAMEPPAGTTELAKKMCVTVNEDGFYSETHIKLYPVESSTKGVYLAGCGQAPKDITDTVSQALATAGKIQILFSNETLLADPLIAEVKPDVCSGCGICVKICPYGARVLDDYQGISLVMQAVCQGCGACIAACPNKACELVNSTSRQFIRMISDFVSECPPLEAAAEASEA